MRVTVLRENSCNGLHEVLEITINDATKFSVHNSEFPEDNTLSENFSDCYDIPEILRMAWEAGKKGESFTIEYEEGETD